jgi:hypothetical protein
MGLLGHLVRPLGDEEFGGTPTGRYGRPAGPGVPALRHAGLRRFLLAELPDSRGLHDAETHTVASLGKMTSGKLLSGVERLYRVERSNSYLLVDLAAIQ